MILEWIRNLLMQVDNMVQNDATAKPDQEIAEGEEVIGPAPEDLQSLYIACTGLYDASQESYSKANALLERTKRGETLEQEEMARLTQHLLDYEEQNIAWELLKHETHKLYPETIFSDPDCIPDIRAGWKLVFPRLKRSNIIKLSTLAKAR